MAKKVNGVRSSFVSPTDPRVVRAVEKMAQASVALSGNRRLVFIGDERHEVSATTFEMVRDFIRNKLVNKPILIGICRPNHRRARVTASATV